MTMPAEMENPTVGKVAGLIVLIGVIWGTLPYLEKFTLIQEPQMPPEYFQFWRGLTVAILVLVCTLIMYHKDLTCMKRTLTWRNFGLIVACAVPVVIFTLSWLHLIRTRVLSVSILYSMGVGIAVFVACLLGYAWTFCKNSPLQAMGEKLHAQNYAGIAFVIIGVILVGLDLKRLQK